MIVISPSLALSEDTSSSDNGVILYDNLVTPSNVTISTYEAAHPDVNVANPATHLFWRGSGSSAFEFPIVTFGTSVIVNSWAFARHNLGSLGATISVFGTNDDLGNSPVVYTQLVDDRILPDDAPFLALFETQPFTRMFMIISLPSATPAPEIGVLYVGQSLFLERSIKIDAGHTPITMGRVTKVINGRSESGNFLGRILINEFRQSQAEFAWFTPAWYRANFDPFVVASKQVPFFYAWHPSEYPLEVGYGWMLDDPMPEVDPVTQRIAVSLRYQGIA